MEVGKTPRTLGPEDEREEARPGEESREPENGCQEGRPQESGRQEDRGQEGSAQPDSQDPGAVAGILSAWIAADPATLTLRDRIPAIAETACTVLIRGESGVGKSLLADLLHYAGPNRDKCLLKFNCACLPPEKLEEGLCSAGLLPGGPYPENYEADAPLLAASGRCGSVVLDEVAALPMPLQARLLHAIEIGRFETVHLIALSAVDMERAVARRSLREDLYLRLNLTALAVPPLRERRADVSALARYFLRQFAELHRRPRARFTETALSALEAYSYPGNVRELRGIVESAVLSGDTAEITLEDLRPYLRENPASTAELSLDEIERQHIAKVLDFTRGKKTRAADILGISRKTLLEKRKRYGFR